MLRIRLRNVAALAAAVVLSAAARATVAVPIPFTVDPAASTFEVGGTLGTSPLTAQSAGSTVVGFTGSLSVDLDAAAGTVSTGFSILKGNNQPADQQPLTSFPGANYGLTTGGASPTALAVRSLTLLLQLIKAPYNAGPSTFTQAGFYVDGGTLYHAAAGGPVGNVDLHGAGADGRVVGPISLTTQGTVQTLTIPVSTHLRRDTGATVIADLTFAGQVVATRVVPEPAAGLAAAVSGAAAGLTRRRPRRRAAA